MGLPVNRFGVALAAVLVAACGETSDPASLGIDGGLWDATGGADGSLDSGDAATGDADLDAALDAVTECVPGRQYSCGTSDGGQACFATRFCDNTGVLSDCQCHACTGLGVAFTFDTTACTVNFDEPLDAGWRDALQVWTPATGDIFRVEEEPDLFPVSGAAACGTADGWYVVGGDTLELCSETCERVQNGAEPIFSLGCSA